MREVFITAAARTAIGDFGGGLKDVAPIDLGATVVKACLLYTSPSPRDS